MHKSSSLNALRSNSSSSPSFTLRHPSLISSSSVSREANFDESYATGQRVETMSTSNESPSKGLQRWEHPVFRHIVKEKVRKGFTDVEALRLKFSVIMIILIAYLWHGGYIK